MANWIRTLFETVVCTLLWCVFHEIAYRFVKQPKLVASMKDEKEKQSSFCRYISHFPAVLHAPVTTIASLYCLYYYGVTYGQSTNGLENIPIMYSASYFIHDLIYGVMHGYNSHMENLHHVLIGGILLFSYGSNMYGNDLCNGLAQGEITNPLLATYEILYFHGFPDNVVQPFGVLFLSSFVFIRTFVSGSQTWMMQHSSSNLWFKISYTGMWSVSLFLVWMVLNKAIKLLSMTFPELKPLQLAYKCAKFLRPYQMHYNVAVSILANIGIVHYYLSK